MADARSAALLNDVFFKLGGEFLERRFDRGHRELAVEAVGPDERLDEAVEVLDVRIAAATGLDAAEDLYRSLGAAVTGGAASAAFVLTEGDEEHAHIQHADRLVEEDKPAAAEKHAFLTVGVQGEREIEASADDAGERAAGLEALVDLAIAHSAGVLLKRLADGGPKGNFHTAGPLDAAREGKHLGALLFGGAYRAPPGGAVAHNHGRVGVRLDVVDVGRLVPETSLSGERGLDAGHAAVAVDRVDQPSLFAADVGACAEEDDQFEIVAGAEDVLPDETLGARLFDRFLHAGEGERVFVADVDVAFVRVGGEGGDQHPFDDDVRVAFHEDAVDPGAGVAFISVADEVARRRGGVAQEVPLPACGETAASASTEAAIEHLLDDRLGVHLQCLAEAFVALVSDVVVDALRVDAAAVLHDAANLALHEGVVGKQRDFRGGEAFDDAEGEFGHVGPFGYHFLEEVVHAFRGDVGVEDGACARRGADGDCWLHPAEAPATDNPDLGVEVFGDDRGAHGGERLFGPTGDR